MAHGVDVADALKAIVCAATSQVDQIRHQIALNFLRVDKMGHAITFTQLLTGRIDINANDHVGTDHAGALHNVEANTTKAEYDNVTSRLNFRCVDHCTDTSGHPASNVTNFVERRVFAYFRNRDFRHHAVFAEGGCAHIVEQLLPADAKATGPVWHQALALRATDGLTQVGFRIEAIFACTTLRRVQRDNMITDLNACDARPNFNDHTSTFVPKDAGKNTLRVRA